MKRMAASAGSQVMVRRGRFQEAQGVAEISRAFAECRSRLQADTFRPLRIAAEPDVQGSDVNSCKHRGGTEADQREAVQPVPGLRPQLRLRAGASPDRGKGHPKYS